MGDHEIVDPSVGPQMRVANPVVTHSSSQVHRLADVDRPTLHADEPEPIDRRDGWKVVHRRPALGRPYLALRLPPETYCRRDPGTKAGSAITGEGVDRSFDWMRQYFGARWVQSLPSPPIHRHPLTDVPALVGRDEHQQSLALNWEPLGAHEQFTDSAEQISDRPYLGGLVLVGAAPRVLSEHRDWPDHRPQVRNDEFTPWPDVPTAT